MVTFNLITGFLGSGKTTLLKNILTKIGGDKKIAVIQNEFASTGIDGKELKQINSHFKLVEINNGSVFCVCQLSNFVNTLIYLLNDYKPEIIFLETSGLADPISIVELLESKELNDKLNFGCIYTLVDAPNFEKYLQRLVRFKHQIMIADKVVINKMDLWSGKVDVVNQKIHKLNPFAELIHTTYAELDWKGELENSKTNGRASKAASAQSAGRPDWSCTVLRTHKQITKQKLLAFITLMQLQCYRIKGFVNLAENETVSIQSVFDRFDIKTIANYFGRTEMVVFSETLSSKHVRKTFNLYL